MSTSPQQVAIDAPEDGDPWSSAPLDAPTALAVQRAIQPLDARQRLWLSGFLAGSAQVSPAPAALAPIAQPVVTVVYGSQSGNCEALAKRIGESLGAQSVPHVVLDMLDCRKRHLEEAQVLLVIVSTHGEGDPPDRAMALHELLFSRKAPSLSQLKYAVLALGDSSYERFCETGKQFDARLASLGAQSFQARADCDVDFEATAAQWIEAAVEWVRREHAGSAPKAASPIARPATAIATAYTRKNPFLAPVLANQRLTARSSDKDVRHIELALDGSGIHYEPGDAIGIVPCNDAADVDVLLKTLDYDGETPLTVDGRSVSLRQALLERCDIGPISRTLLEKYAAQVADEKLNALLLPDSKEQLQQFMHGRDLIDLVTAHRPQGLDAEQFIRLLRPLGPRLYSIASSQRASPDEVHLTVGLVQYEALGRKRFGVASRQLAGLQEDGAAAPVYLHRNPNFRLPADPDAPIIMIGPGTGVAPYRGFLAERDALGARGRNWLFFGERHFVSDFLYQSEWLDFRKRGLLHRIEVAFSRDQASKVYVQHRMREHGRELYDWIQNGAYIYVCGDATHMAADVQRALLDILQSHGSHSPERAAEALLELQRERRYQRDVY